MKRSQQENPRQIPQWAPLAVVTFTGVLYCRAIFNGFTVLDDAYFINDNPLIKDLSWNGIRAIFTSFYACNYDPFTNLAYLFLFKAFGLEPLPFHLLSVVFHLPNTWLVFLLADGLSGKKITALVVSILFAIHPMHVESVAWVSELKDVMYAFFYLLLLICYLHYLSSGFRMKYYAGTFLLFIAAAFSKPAAVSLPVLLMAVDVYKGRAVNKRSIIDKTPLLIVSVFFGILNIIAQAADHALNAIEIQYGFINRAFLFTAGLASYLIRLTAPFGLSAMHYYPATTGDLLPWFYYASLPLIVLVVFLITRKSSFKKDIVFGISFFLINIFLMLQVIPFGKSLFSERYTYLAYIGLFFIAGQWIAKLNPGKWRNAVIWASVLVLVSFSAITWTRIGVWKNDDTIFGDIICKNEGNRDCFYAYYVLGKNRYEDKDFPEAMQDFNESIALDPYYPEARTLRGILYLKDNDLQPALTDFDCAIRSNPSAPTLYFNRASVKARMGDFKGAIGDYNFFLKMDPYNGQAYAALGVAVLGLKDTIGACQDFEKSVQYGNNEATPLVRMFCH